MPLPGSKLVSSIRRGFTAHHNWRRVRHPLRQNIVSDSCAALVAPPQCTRGRRFEVFGLSTEREKRSIATDIATQSFHAFVSNDGNHNETSRWVEPPQTENRIEQ